MTKEAFSACLVTPLLREALRKLLSASRTYVEDVDVVAHRFAGRRKTKETRRVVLSNGRLRRVLKDVHVKRMRP